MDDAAPVAHWVCQTCDDVWQVVWGHVTHLSIRPRPKVLALHATYQQQQQIQQVSYVLPYHPTAQLPATCAVGSHLSHWDHIRTHELAAKGQKVGRMSLHSLAWLHNA